MPPKERKGSLFFEAKYKKYSVMISLKSPEEARKSAQKLKNEFDGAMTREKKIRLLKIAVLAENRAQASLKRKSLSLKERNEFREIANIYKRTGDRFGEQITPKEPKYAARQYRKYIKNKRRR